MVLLAVGNKHRVCHWFGMKVWSVISILFLAQSWIQEIEEPVLNKVFDSYCAHR